MAKSAAAVKDVPDPAPEAPKWQDQLYELLKTEGFTQFAYVPDAGHRILIDRSLADPDVHSIALTTEEEGVAVAAGAHLGGAKAVLLMQSSGAGNCINMLSLSIGGRFPLVTILSMRGDFGEMNQWQMPMGQSIQKVLEATGVICLRADEPAEVLKATKAAVDMAYRANCAVAVLLTQRLLGAKGF